MMNQWIILIVGSLLYSKLGCEGSHILFMTPFTAPSHSSFFKPVIWELAKRGHTITNWSGLRPSLPTKNINGTDEIEQRIRHLFSKSLSERFNFDQYGIDWNVVDHPFKLLFTLSDRLAQTCTAMYQDPVFNMIRNSTRNEFDLIVVDAVMNDCVLPLIHILDKPLIYMNVISPMPWLLDTLGSPLSLESFPVPGFEFPDRMELWQRVTNTLTGIMGYYYRNWFMAATVDQVARRMLGDPSLPPIVEIEKKHLSMLVTNTHHSINYQLPINAAIVEAGGLHCLPSKPLQQDLEDFVSGSGEDGFIIVSFGSIVRGADMPIRTRDHMLSAFSRLRQRVVWKWEDDSKLSNYSVPSNIKLMPWIPQQDLLGHRLARLFITHGGLFSNQEAVYHGVPFIGLPVFIDQPINVRKAALDGYAIHLSWAELTEDVLYDAIQEMLNNTKYTERVRQVSVLMRDQLERPLDRAVYSIEYVIRHGGARHLRTAARDLTLFQRGMLDIIFILALAGLIIAAFIYLTLRWLVRRLLASCRSPIEKKKKKTKLKIQ